MVKGKVRLSGSQCRTIISPCGYTLKGNPDAVKRVQRLHKRNCVMCTKAGELPDMDVSRAKINGDSGLCRSRNGNLSKKTKVHYTRGHNGYTEHDTADTKEELYGLHKKDIEFNNKK